MYIEANIYNPVDILVLYLESLKKFFFFFEYILYSRI